MYETTIGGEKTVMYTTVETAKEVRKALKAAFPKVKFSVRSDSYAGGASIRVSYNKPGMPRFVVERVTDQFEGASFDPMIDLKSYKYGEHEGRRVAWGADFVFVSNDADW
jgi:stress-induced morphogen